MKHATRILALMLSIAMLLALAACGGSAASTASAPAEEASAPAPAEEAAPAEQAAAPAEAEPAVEEAAASAAEASAAEPAEEPAPELPVVEYPLFDETHTYTIWLGTAPDLNDVVKNMEEFVIFRELEKVTNVTWDATMVSFMAESEQFQLMVAGGDFTDVVCKAIDNYNGTVDQAIEEDFLIDLTPYIEDNMPNLLTWFQTYPELRKALMSNDGAIGGFPKFYREYSDITSGPMIRADWLDQLGLENPKTFDEMYDVLCAFRDQKGVEHPLEIANSSGVQAELISGYNIAAGYYQVDGEVRYGAIQPEFKDYLTMMNKWYSEGLVRDAFLSNPYESLMDFSPLLNNETGIWYGTAAQAMTYMLSSATDPNMAITGVTNVTVDGSQAHVGESGTLLDTPMWSITTVCEDPDVIARYVDYVYSDDGILLANYGVEGETFTYVDGVPRLTDMVLNNPDYSYGAAMNIFVCDRMTPAPFIIDEDRVRADYVQDQLNAIAIWNESNDGLYNMPRAGINLTVEESQEYNRIYADIETYEDEHIVKFVVGDESLDEFDNFVSTLKQMGIEDCIAIEQAAYDRYLES